MFIKKKYFPRCYALLSNAVIFLILRKLHVECILANKNSVNFRTSQLTSLTYLLMAMATTACFGLKLEELREFKTYQ